MKTDFWNWLDRKTEKANASEVGKIMVAAGYTVGHTGGGCLVWEKNFSGGYLWICDEGNGLGESLTEAYLVGAYDNDGEPFDSDTMPSLRQAVEWCECRTECFATKAA